MSAIKHLNENLGFIDQVNPYSRSTAQVQAYLLRIRGSVSEVLKKRQPSPLLEVTEEIK